MKDQTINWRLDFDGVLSEQVRSSLIEELIKYIIFERRQIPSAFDQLKRNEQSENDDPGKKKVTDRKMDACIEGIDLILATIRDVFSKTDRIHQVLMILGPTIVSPKELYTIRLPEGSYDGELLLRRKCIQIMIRRLITEDIFKNCKELSTTNIHVFIRCPNDVNVDNLQPKLNFEVPKRGQKFELEIGCNCERLDSVDDNCDLENSVEDTSPLAKMLEDCDISGVGLLDETVENPCDAPTFAFTAEGKENESEGSAAAEKLVEAPLIWYRVNANVKGCRGKAAECGGLGWC